MPENNHRGVRRRHASPTNVATRSSHGGSIDPTESRYPLYGSEMDVGPITTPEYQGQLHDTFIADNAIGQRHLQALAVLAENLADNAVAQRSLQDLAVGTNNLQALSITTAKIDTRAVTAEKILAGSITADKISVAGL